MKKFRILSQSDERIVNGLLESLNTARAKIENSTIVTFEGPTFSKVHELVSAEVDTPESQDFREFMSLNGYLLKTLNVTLANGLRIEVRRHDDTMETYVEINDTSNSSNNIGGLRVRAAIQNCLVAVETEPYRRQIAGELFSRNLEARENELSRLQDISRNFFSRLAAQEAKAAETHRERESALIEKLDSQRVSQEKALSDRARELDERASELSALQAAIDDRESRSARRAIRKDMHDTLKEFLDRQGKTMSTGSPPRGILVRLWNGPYFAVDAFCWFLMILSGALLVYFLFFDSGKIPTSDTSNSWIVAALEHARALVAGLSFGATAIFYLKFNNNRYERRLNEEELHRQLGLDMDRASWIVEMAMEWKAEKHDEVPESILEWMSRGLFERQQGQKTDLLHPAEQALAALLGTAVRVKAGPNGLEADLSPKRAQKRMNDAS